MPTRNIPEAPELGTPHYNGQNCWSALEGLHCTRQDYQLRPKALGNKELELQKAYSNKVKPIQGLGLL